MTSPKKAALRNKIRSEKLGEQLEVIGALECTTYEIITSISNKQPPNDYCGKHILTFMNYSKR
jgi:hypothetical protein